MPNPPLDVCFWGKADIDLTPRNVRYWSNSGHRLNAQDVPRCVNCTPSSENRHLTNERAFFCWPFYFSTRRPALVDRPWTIHRRSRTAANADCSVCQKSTCPRAHKGHRLVACGGNTWSYLCSERPKARSPTAASPRYPTRATEQMDDTGAAQVHQSAATSACL